MAFRKAGKRKDPRKGVKRAQYNVPDALDLKLHQEKIDKLSKGLDNDGRPKPLTENQLKALIRDGVRKKWMSCNQKLAFLERQKEPDYDAESRRLWKWKCAECGEYFCKEDVNVDHKKGNNTFTEIEGAHHWASAILNAGGEEDLQILCAEGPFSCHSLKTCMEDTGLDLTGAILYKKATCWEEGLKGKIPEQKIFLKSKGFTDADISNKEKRRAAYIEFLISLER